MRFKNDDWFLEYSRLKLGDPEPLLVRELTAKALESWSRYHSLIAGLSHKVVKGSFRLNTKLDVDSPALPGYEYGIDCFPSGSTCYFIQAEYGCIRVGANIDYEGFFSAKKSQFSGQIITTPVYKDEVLSEYIFGAEDLDFIYALFYAILSRQDLHQFAYNGYELEWFYSPSDKLE